MRYITYAVSRGLIVFGLELVLRVFEHPLFPKHVLALLSVVLRIQNSMMVLSSSLQKS